jgi:hypothetical protein
MAFTTQSTNTLQPVQRLKKPSSFLSPSQLAEYVSPFEHYGNHLTSARLKNGPRVNVIIGPDGDRFIGIEGASINLMAHFSPYAKKTLLDERASTLSILNGSKQTIQWIYKYMRAGDIDAHGQEKFESLSVDSLVLLYTHSAFLEYMSLMDRAFGRLKGQYYDSLPTVDEIKTFQVCVPPLYEHAINILADEIMYPWACSYSAYSELAMSDQAFSDKLDQTIKDLLARRVEASEKYYATTKNRQVIWAKQYYKTVKNSKVGLTEQEVSKRVTVDCPIDLDSKPKDSAVKKERVGRNAKACNSTNPLADTMNNQYPTSGAHNEAGTNARKSKSAHNFSCYYCGEDGHIARNCTAKAAATIQAADTIKRSTIVCNNCKEEGHIACICNAPAKVSEKTVKRDATGRNRNVRRPQKDRADRRIDVAGNGEGIRTCDREVRKGEVTRTGLII